MLLDSLKKLLDLKTSEQGLADNVVHDLQLSGFAINPLSASDLAAKQAMLAATTPLVASEATSVTKENPTAEATEGAASRIPA